MKIKYIAIIVAYLMTFGVVAYVRFSNPNLTETQLLIEFWYVWIGIILVVAGLQPFIRKE